MKKLPFFAFFFLAVIVFLSCKKERSCEGCAGNNEPPLAAAGLDQTITLPTDSVLLDGSKSSDPDGKISAWQWTKIAGPAFLTITNATTAQTVVKNLTPGAYQFQLKVTDDKGALAKDTVQVNVNNPAQPNRPPVACAGADQVITLPTNATTLDGSCSTDPDNDITSYLWTKISGPSANIVSSNAVQTPVTGLVQGVYQFELMVTDAKSLSSKDTIQLTLNAAVVPYTCGDTNRPRINARLIEVGTLSLPRMYMAVASVGDKILFAGGSYGFTQAFYSRVDIYNVATNTWSTAELSIARFSMAAVAAGNKIFFAGGDGSDGAFPLTNVDVYDASTNAWSQMHLSRRNQGIAAAAVGNKVLFAGGEYPSRVVDIFDLTTNTWSKDSISFNMGTATAVTVNNKVYYGGNCNQDIIIYDNNTNTWSTKALNESRGNVAGINAGNKIYWGGGAGCDSYNNTLCSVEIHDLNSGDISMQNLSGPKAFWNVSGQNAVLKDNKIIFCKSELFTNNSDPFSGGKFDIYDITTNTWSIGVLPFPIEDASIISVNNTVYMAGGRVNGVISNKVWKLEF